MSGGACRKGRGLGMAGQLNGGELCAGLWVKDDERAIAVANVDALSGLIVADIVGVVSTLHRADGLKGTSVNDATGAILPVGNKGSVEFGNVGNALRLGEARKALVGLACFQVEHF